MTTATTFPFKPWSLSRILILNLAGAFAGLMVDIRLEHVDAVREHSIAWTPIIYAAGMTVACLTASVIWTAAIRRLMIVLFSLALAVGGLGFYFHSHGHFIKVFKTSARAWTDPEMSHPDTPPQFAPLAFAGLGALGILASLKRFDP